MRRRRRKGETRKQRKLEDLAQDARCVLVVHVSGRSVGSELRWCATNVLLDGAGTCGGLEAIGRPNVAHGLNFDVRILWDLFKRLSTAWVSAGACGYRSGRR